MADQGRDDRLNKMWVSLSSVSLLFRLGLVVIALEGP